MKRLVILLSIILALVLWGCAGELNITQENVDTAAKTAEKALMAVIENINWEELKESAQQGYDSLTERFPALKSDNIKAFLKDNGLSLLNKLVESTNAETQENAKKLGQILKILYPELTDEVDAVLPDADTVS